MADKKTEAATATAVESDLAKRIKKVPNWETLSDAALATAVEQQIKSEAIVPSAAEIVAAARIEKDAIANIVYDKRTALLSVNRGLTNTAVSCVVREAAIVNGQQRERAVVKTLATADTAKIGHLSAAEQEFIAAVQAALTKFMGS